MIWYNSQKDLDEGGVEIEPSEELREAIERIQEKEVWYLLKKVEEKV